MDNMIIAEKSDIIHVPDRSPLLRQKIKKCTCQKRGMDCVSYNWYNGKVVSLW